MRIVHEHHIYTHLDPAEERKLDQVIAALNAIKADVAILKERTATMLPQLDELAAKVAANTSAVNSAVEILTTLKARLDADIAESDLNTEDQARFQALSDELGANSQKLADAVVANTPAA